VANILEFLRHVLPDEGLKCATILPSREQKFFTNFEQLAAFLTQQDALGFAAYHACASFKTSDSRKADNVLCAQSFWQDLDAGEGKAYPDARSAYEAVRRFCTETHLPMPVCVGSGSGLHTYWPLVETLDPARWRACAERLFELCQKHGLHVDPSRARDLASILRPPGTFNRKHGGYALVQVGELVGPFDLAEDLGAINASALPPLLGDVQRSGSPQVLAGPSAAAGRPDMLARATAGIFRDEPSDVELIYDRCDQIARLFETRGQVSDPDWYAVVGVLRHAVGGRDFAYECASPEWHSAIDRKFAQKEHADIAPTTCAHFRSINPSGCVGCVFADRVATPLQLGRTSFTITPPVRPAADRPRVLGDWADGAGHDAGRGCLAVEGYTVRPDGLVFATEKNGQPVERIVSPYRLYLAAVQRGEDGERYSLCFHNHVPKLGLQEIRIGAGELLGPTGRSKLAELGAIVYDMDMFKQYAQKAQKMLTEQDGTSVQYEQFGWKDDETAFVVGSRIYVGGECKPAAGSQLLAGRAKMLGPKKGSLQEWSVAANALFQAGMEANSFACLASFATPFMRFHHGNEGGAIISLVTPESAKGKTTSLEGATSVWGEYDACRLTNRDTMNAKGILMGALGNMLVIYDEIMMKDPVVLYEYVQDFTNGRDRARATTDGSLKQQKAKWQTILFTASNKSLVEQLMAHPENQDAMQFRVIELPVAFDKRLASQGDDLRRGLERNAGHAGDAYMRFITRPEIIAHTRQMLPQLYKQITERYKFQPEHRYWVRVLSAVALAGVYVRHLSILDCSVQRVVDWTAEHLVNRIGDATVTGRLSAANMIVGFMDAHVRGRLVMARAFKPGDTSNHPLQEPAEALVMRIDVGESQAAITETALRRWMLKNGGNWSQFKQELVQHGLGKIAFRTLGAGTKWSSGQTTVVEINLTHSALSGVMATVTELKPSVTIVANTRQDRMQNFKP